MIKLSDAERFQRIKVIVDDAVESIRRSDGRAHFYPEIGLGAFAKIWVICQAPENTEFMRDRIFGIKVPQ